MKLPLELLTFEDSVRAQTWRQDVLDESTQRRSRRVTDRLLGELELLTVDDLNLATPAVSLVGDLLYRGWLSRVVGPSRSYKSFFAVGLACAVALGRDWGPHQVAQRGRVVYGAAEGADGLGKRVFAWCQFYGVDPAELRDWFFVLRKPLQLSNPGHVEFLRHHTERRDPALVVFDTQARFTSGQNENSAEDTGVAVQALARVTEDRDCTPLLVHHTGKNGTARGSSAWFGALDTELVVELTGPNKDASGRPKGFTVEARKHKDAPDGHHHSFDLLESKVPEGWLPNVTDADSRGSLVAVPTKLHTSVVDQVERGARKQPTVDAVLAWLRQQRSETGSVPGRPTLKDWCEANDLHLADRRLGALVKQVKEEAEG